MADTEARRPSPHRSDRSVIMAARYTATTTYAKTTLTLWNPGPRFVRPQALDRRKDFGDDQRLGTSLRLR